MLKKWDLITLPFLFLLWHLWKVSRYLICKSSQPLRGIALTKMPHLLFVFLVVSTPSSFEKTYLKCEAWDCRGETVTWQPHQSCRRKGDVSALAPTSRFCPSLPLGVCFPSPRPLAGQGAGCCEEELFSLCVDMSEVQGLWAPKGTKESTAHASPSACLTGSQCWVLRRVFSGLYFFFSQLDLPF